jgi:REP element-mobilizing transposase RayT
LIFSTKDREPLIAETIRTELWAYMAGVIRESGGEALIVNGASDHAHVLMLLPTVRSVSEMVRLIKSNSSKWVRETARKSAFAWQRGYAAFSVSQSNLQGVSKYIAEQEEHHRKKSFQEEYRGFLEKHGFAFDERYMWD